MIISGEFVGQTLFICVMLTIVSYGIGVISEMGELVPSKRSDFLGKVFVITFSFTLFFATAMFVFALAGRIQ